MWIQVRSMVNPKDVLRVDDISKLTKIEMLRDRLVDHFQAPVERQKLFYRGKQLVNGHSLFDYGVELNEIIQILVGAPPSNEDDEKAKSDVDEAESDKENQKPAEEAASSSADDEVDNNSLYKLGDIVDVRDETMGAWFEGDIIRIKRVCPEENDDGQKTGEDERVVNDPYIYSVAYHGYDDEDPTDVSARNIRPRAYQRVALDKLAVGDKVMVNYNYDEPEERGYWYDAIVTATRCTRTIKQLTATVHIGKDLVPFENCNIKFLDEVFQIEQVGTQRNVGDPEAETYSQEKRKNKPDCDVCHDNPRRKCKSCSCRECGDKKDPDKQLICDECEEAVHIYCLSPPLETIPDDDEWFCPICKVDTSEVVGAGEKLKESRKKAKMPSAQNKSTRDWGKGMACAGRTKVCAVVPPNHFGPIPGVEVGSSWKFRVQVGESGVHRSIVGGIHGREQEGAYSIALSGGYEDDEDNGDSFTYTGSGGRDLSGNKRTAAQSCDQTLTRMNRALAKNCNAPLDNKKGAEAKDWKGGRPVRVIRNVKGRKHSKYAPTEGNRYDGIYKVVKYWPDKGQAGFIVWRYLLRRDDPAPAPWTKAGQERINDLGLEMQYPDGYLEGLEEKERRKEEEDESTTDSGDDGKKKKKPGRKRKRAQEEDGGSPAPTPPPKRKFYEVDEAVMKSISADKRNAKTWEEALEARSQGGKGFLSRVEELFCCVCCQDIICQPVTTNCCHNICKMCVKRSFDAEVYNCPVCREELGKNYKMEVNSDLMSALRGLFPGYENGR